MHPDDRDRAERVAVLQLVDTLDGGGMERVCVSVANALPRDRFRSFLCTSRREGPLAETVAPDVGRLSLGRRGRFDLAAIRRFVRFVRQEDVRIIHAHGPSVFLAVAAAAFAPRARVVWHVHAGRLAEEDRPGWAYRPVARRTAAVLVVSAALRGWVARRLRVRADRIWQVPNFVEEPGASAAPTGLPGEAGARIVCVANLRAAKDHETLLEAMKIVRQSSPAHLLLVGAAPDAEYRARVESRIREHAMESSVTWMGPRSDVPAILRASDVGVLSSRVEGLPVALIEYGAAGLAVVATDVGACGDVLDGGRVGRLVPPGDPAALAAGILGLLRSPDERRRLGASFQARVRERFGREAAIALIGSAYDRAMEAA